MVDGLAEEARAGHGAHTHLRREVLAEFEVAVIAKLRDVHHDVVGALRHVMLKTDAVESLAEQVALGGVEVEDLIVIAVVEGDVSMGINLKISRCNSRLWEVYSFFGVGASAWIIISGMPEL